MNGIDRWVGGWLMDGPKKGGMDEDGWMHMDG